MRCLGAGNLGFTGCVFDPNCSIAWARLAVGMVYRQAWVKWTAWFWTDCNGRSTGTIRLVTEAGVDDNGHGIRAVLVECVL